MPLLRSGHFCAILSHTTDFSPFIRSATALQKRIRSDSRPDPRQKETVPFSGWQGRSGRSEEHTSELQSRGHLVCRLLLEKKKKLQKSSRNILKLIGSILTAIKANLLIL